jgi:hypothetical protein
LPVTRLYVEEVIAEFGKYKPASFAQLLKMFREYTDGPV